VPPSLCGTICDVQPLSSTLARLIRRLCLGQGIRCGLRSLMLNSLNSSSWQRLSCWGSLKARLKSLRDPF
jgi:hypothetical protein